MRNLFGTVLMILGAALLIAPCRCTGSTQGENSMFACTYDGRSRVTVSGDRIENE